MKDLDCYFASVITLVVVSTPYSYSCGVVPPDGEDMLEAAHGVAAALRIVHGTPMKVCPYRCLIRACLMMGRTN